MATRIPLQIVKISELAKRKDRGQSGNSSRGLCPGDRSGAGLHNWARECASAAFILREQLMLSRALAMVGGVQKRSEAE